MIDFLPLIGTYGFPIFVCIWFMWRMEKFIQENTKVLNALCVSVNLMRKDKK